MCIYNEYMHSTHVDRIADPASISVENIVVNQLSMENTSFLLVPLLDAKTSPRTTRLGLGRILS